MKVNVTTCLSTFVMLIFLSSCSNEKNTLRTMPESEKLFSIKTPAESGISFRNQIIESEQNNHLVWESIYNGGGVGVGDINNDGLMDIYFTGNMTEDKLYLNQGNLQFEDITQSAGINEPDWSSGVTFADVNNDGNVDIYVCKMSWLRDGEDDTKRTNKLYINNGDNTFTESAKKYGIADKGHSTQASFFDYDKDGLLDLYVMNAPSHRYDQKLVYMKTGQIPYEFRDHLYHNNGNGFTDATALAFPPMDPAFGLGLATQDLNGDGWTDIYVANDFEKPDLMLINNKQGGFNNELAKNLKHISYSSMGMDVADINNDVLPDIAVLDMQSNDHVRSKTNMPSMNIQQFWQNVSSGYHFQFMANMLQLNNGSGFYSDIGQLSGIASTDWSWSILLSDMDNDGYKDALITNGINRNIKDNDFNIMMQNTARQKGFSFLELAMQTKVEKVKNFAFKNQKGNLKFEDVSTTWGFDHNGFSYGAAYADFDNDGDLDVAVNNSNEVSHLYENMGNGIGNYLRVKATNKGQPALNAKVYIKYNNKQQYAEVANVRGYQSCSEPIVHFGMYDVNKVDLLTIIFPDGKIIEKSNVKTNQLISIDYNDARKGQVPDFTESLGLLKDISKITGIEYYHVENEFNDFDNQILIPHMETRNGPIASVGDVNGDGLDDLFLGSAKGDFGLIYIQNLQGSMVYLPNIAFDDDRKYEDSGSEFFDVDNDGDLDLYVSTGGSEDEEGSDWYQDRLYINNGKGQFDKSVIDLPKSNGSIVVQIDVDNDGYMDLFVGGRMKGQTYPYPGTSHLLMNRKGRLVEDTNFKYKSLGMVTSALAEDVNGDGNHDLIITGEWMQPTFLVNNSGVLNDETDKLLSQDLRGWWFDIEKADLDGDGVNEILLGNIGENNKFHVSEDNPLKVYGADFDQNNKSDIVLAKNTKYGEVPVRGFQCSSEQLPMLKEKFNSYSDFAHAQIEDLIDIKNSNTLNLEAREFRSGYLKKKDERYIFIPFPPQAQISAIQGLVASDVNSDGITDVIASGNLFDAEVETTRHDASVGVVMVSGKEGLKAMSPIESGFYAPGNVKDAVKFTLNDKQCILIMNNNANPQVFEIK